MEHWPEYLMEAVGLGSFMVSACAFGVLLEHPGSPIRQAIQGPAPRRILMGLAMGLTAIGLIYSPLGQRSGAHFNPPVTLTVLRLGKVTPRDGVFYILAQFAGGVVGVGCAAIVLGQALAHPAVNYVVTMPGRWGIVVAFLAEIVISFGLMSTVLIVSNTEGLARFTGLFAGVLVAAYITLEAPISGMSMKPSAHLRLGRDGRHVDGSPDLLHGPASRNAAGGRGLHSRIREPPSQVCNTPSPEQRPLYLPMRGSTTSRARRWVRQRGEGRPCRNQIGMT